MSPTPKLIKGNVLMIFGITLIAVMGVASISPALPSIQEYFKLEKGQIKWLISVFSLPGFLLSFFLGVMADRFGRKTILIPSLLLFSISGFLCSFSNSFHELLIFRFFQGLGAASLSSINNTLIGDFYEGSRRIKIMGYNAAILSIGTALFPAIGGIIAGSKWQIVFYLPLLALPLALSLFIFLKPPERTKSSPIRIYLKSLWLTVNQRKVWGLFLTNLLVFIILYGAYLTFFPILLKQRFLAGSTTIGITMSVTSIATAMSASQLSRLRTKINAKLLLYFSAVLYAVSLVLIGFAESWGLIIFSIILFGMAHGLYIPNIQSLLVGLSPAKERAAFMSLNSMILRFGQFLGPILIGSLYINDNLLFSFLGASFIALIMVVVQRVMVKIDEN
jgi:MFS family permease